MESDPEPLDKQIDTYESLKNFLGLALPSEVDPREVARWFYHSTGLSPKAGKPHRWLAAQPLLRLYTAVEDACNSMSLRLVEFYFCLAMLIHLCVVALFATDIIIFIVPLGSSTPTACAHCCIVLLVCICHNCGLPRFVSQFLRAGPPLSDASVEEDLPAAAGAPHAAIERAARCSQCAM